MKRILIAFLALAGVCLGQTPVESIRHNLGGNPLTGSNANTTYSLVANVRYYGAVGDGSHNDTSAIAAAISSLGGHPGKVLLPLGNYLVSGSGTLFTLPNGTVVEGDSSGDGPNAGSTITYLGPGTVFSLGNQCTLRDLAILGHQGSVQAGSVGILLNNEPGNDLIENVGVLYFDKNIRTLNTIINTLVNVTSLYGNYGLYVDTGTNVLSIFGGQISAGENGVLIPGSAGNINFYGVTIEGNSTTGVVISGTAIQSNINFHGCYFETNTPTNVGNDILFNNLGNNNPCFGGLIEGCQFESAYNGVNIQGAKGIIIQGNFFAGASGGSAPIILGGSGPNGARGCTVGPNTYYNNTTPYSAATNDIGVQNMQFGGLIGTWTPVLVGWTNTGTQTLAGTYFQNGNIITATCTITTTGGGHVIATQGTSSISGLPLTVQTAGGQCSVIDNSTGASLGAGSAYSTSIYPCAISSTSDQILIICTYPKYN